MEDIVEEIVGEIQDEYDEEEILITKLGPGLYLVDGSVMIQVPEHVLGTEPMRIDSSCMRWTRRRASGYGVFQSADASTRRPRCGEKRSTSARPAVSSTAFGPTTAN